MLGWFGKRRRADDDRARQLACLRAEFDADCERLLALGLAGGVQWDERLAGLGVTPAGVRADVAATQSAGVPAHEFRLAGEALAEQYEDACSPLWHGDPLPGLQAFRSHLRSASAQLHERFLASVRPASGFAAVFANAAASSPRHFAGGAPARASTIRCRSCGSPRAAETETQCRYCGQDIL